MGPSDAGALPVIEAYKKDIDRESEKLLAAAQ